MTERPIRVFAHLASDKDRAKWASRHAAGLLVGRNDPTPYGYGRASRMGCTVSFSRSAPENVPHAALRVGARLLLGYDREHARRQVEAMLESDVVWCHTESQSLAVADVLGVRRPGRPAIIGQVVWLLDRWPKLTSFHRRLFTTLVSRLDILLTLSPSNAALARDLFPNTRVEVVPFGIPSEDAVPPADRRHAVNRVVAVGNDRHRDWQTLYRAFADEADVDLRVFSGTAPPFVERKKPRAEGGQSRITIGAAKDNAELNSAYAAASVAVVPLLPNLHASGITAIQEAILAGVPVVATDVGGLGLISTTTPWSTCRPATPKRSARRSRVWRGRRTLRIASRERRPVSGRAGWTPKATFAATSISAGKSWRHEAHQGRRPRVGRDRVPAHDGMDEGSLRAGNRPGPVRAACLPHPGSPSRLQ